MLLQFIGAATLLKYAGATALLKYAGATELLESAGATTVLSSVRTAMTGAGVATPGAGAVVVVPKNQSVDGGSNGNQQDTTVPEEYLLTHQAILVIVKSWDVGTYNPPGTNCTSWLGKIHNFCDQYGIPDTQRAPCAMHHMRADCKEAAHSARCYWPELGLSSMNPSR